MSDVAVQDVSLSAEELAFVECYLRERSAARAFLAAKPGSTSAGARGRSWLERPRIIKAIAEARAAALEEIGVNRAEVLKATARLGFVDVRRAFAPDGQPLNIVDMPADVAACIVGCEVAVTRRKSGDEVLSITTTKLRFSDRLQALRSVGDAVAAWRPADEAAEEGPMPERLEALMKAATESLEAGMGTAMNRLDKIEAMAAAARSRAMRAAEEDFAKVEDARIVSETPIS